MCKVGRCEVVRYGDVQGREICKERRCEVWEVGGGR